MYDVTRKYNCIEIGVQGENLSRDIQFDCNAWIKKLGAGTVTLVHQRWGDEYPYPCPVEMEDGIATWHPTSADVQFEGWGMLNVTFVIGEKIAKSIVYPTHVADSLGQGEEPPEEYQAWIDYVATLAAQADTAKDGAVQAKEDAEDARDAARGFADNAEQSAQNAENAKQAIFDTTATGSVDANVGTPSVVVTKSIEGDHVNIDFEFRNMKGNTGDSGVHVGSDTPGPGKNVWINPSGGATFTIYNGEVTYE